MAARPIWRGNLRLALVACPVALYSARHDRRSVRFNMINPKTGHRIKMVTQDAETGEEISRGDTVKGYEYEKNHYVIMTDEDFESVKVESSSTMMVEKFVDAASIDPIYYESAYYLAPDGKGADDVYAVLRDAIEKTGKVALTRVVISQRERTVALRPMQVEGGGWGLVAHTLNEAQDLNSGKELFADVQHVKIDPEMVKLAVQLIERQSGAYDPSDLEDRYETRLRAMLDAKVRGVAADEPTLPAVAHSNVVDIMDALRKSLAGASGKAAAQPTAAKEAKAPAKRAAKAKSGDERRQPGLKLPIEGGKGKAATKAAPAPATEAAPRRRKAS